MPSMTDPDTGAILIVVLVVLTVLADGGTSVAALPADGYPATTGTSAPGSISQESVAIDNESIEQQYGDVVRVPVTLNGTDEATLHIRNRSTGASTTISVVDADGDSRVLVEINTHLAGRDDSRTIGAAGPDTAVANTTPTLALRPGNYTLTATAGNRTARPPADEEATLEITRRGVHDLTLWRVRQGLKSTITTPGAIREIAANGSLQHAPYLTVQEAPDGPVAFQDVLVVELSVTGLGGMLAAQDGPNTTARFFSLLDRQNVSLIAKEDESTVGTQHHPFRLDLQSYRTTTVVADPANDTYYLVVDLDYALVTNPTDSRSPEVGDGFQVSFHPPYDGHVASTADQPVTSSTVLAETKAEFLEFMQFEPVRVAPQRNYVLHLWTTMPPGTQVTVAVTANESFEQSRTVQVNPDRSIRPQFDFSELSVGDRFVVRIRSQGTLRAEQPGVVDPVSADLTVLEARRANGTIEATIEVSTDDGGFVVLFADGTDGRPTGARSFSPGNHSNLTLTWPVDKATDPVVALFRDDHNGVFEFQTGYTDPLEYPDEPYVDNGSLVSAPVRFTTPTATPTPTDRDGTRYFPPIVPEVLSIRAIPTDEVRRPVKNYFLHYETPTASPSPTPTAPQSPASPTIATSPGVGVLGALLTVAGLAVLVVRRQRP